MSRVRPTWPDLPAFVRAAVEREAGGPVLSWSSHDGGFSPGWALALTTSAGEVFVKVTTTEHTRATEFHRAEAVRSAALPASVPAPRFRWAFEVPDDGGERTWVAVASDVVHGRAPRTAPWDLEDLDRLAHLAHRIGEHVLAPDDVFPEFGAPWPQAARLADERPAGLATYDPWLAANLDRVVGLASLDRQAAAFAGDRLVHGDLRADNALITRRGDVEEAVAIDWPHANRGAAFIDQLGLLPSVAAAGGPSPAQALARVPLPAGTDEEAVTVFVAGLVGYFVWSSLQEPPPGIPHLRAFQRAQGVASLDWLRERLAGGR